MTVGTEWQRLLYLSGLCLLLFPLTSMSSSEESAGEEAVLRRMCSCCARYWDGVCLAARAQCSSSLWSRGRLAWKTSRLCFTQPAWTRAALLREHEQLEPGALLSFSPLVTSALGRPTCVYSGAGDGLGPADTKALWEALRAPSISLPQTQ